VGDDSLREDYRKEKDKWSSEDAVIFADDLSEDCSGEILDLFNN
jgi:hypothetical protein